MPVLMIAEVEGQTQEMYDGMLTSLGEPMRRAKGFIAHGAGPHEGQWRVFEIWDSKADSTAWFAEVVHPNLPPGVKIKRTFQELGRLVMR